MTVNALHIHINPINGVGGADVVISSAHADITCPTGSPVICAGDDFEVGEGEDHNPNTGDDEEHSVASSSKQNDDGSQWGHMEFVRHGRNPLTVHATKITKFVRWDAYTRHIEGWCEINGEGGHTFEADETDNSTRGGRDEFHMKTDRGDEGGGELEHGDGENEEPCNPQRLVQCRGVGFPKSTPPADFR